MICHTTPLQYGTYKHVIITKNWALVACIHPVSKFCQVEEALKQLSMLSVF